MNQETLNRLLTKKNAHTVGEGYKIKDGELTSQEAIVVYVKKKEARDKLSDEDFIPAEIDGIPTDVQEEEEFTPLDDCGTYANPEERIKHYETKQPGGVCISNITVSCGTDGLWVRDRETKEPLSLSDAHVLCEDPRKNVSEQITDIVQPCHMINGDNIICGTLVKHSQLIPDLINKCDAGLRKPYTNDLVNNTVLGIGTPTQSNGEPNINDQVTASSYHGLQHGTIKLINAIVKVNYGEFTATFNRQTITDKMLTPGSSGSAIFTKGTTELVGLGFAGSSTSSVYTPIEIVFGMLDIELIPFSAETKVITLGPIDLTPNPDDPKTWIINGGPIRNSKTEELITQATIRYTGNGQTTTINTTTGFFSIEGIYKADDAEISLQAAGYEDKTIPIKFPDQT